MRILGKAWQLQNSKFVTKETGIVIARVIDTVIVELVEKVMGEVLATGDHGVIRRLAGTQLITLQTRICQISWKGSWQDFGRRNRS